MQLATNPDVRYVVADAQIELRKISTDSRTIIAQKNGNEASR
jgi:hypothetical protein